MDRFEEDEITTALGFLVRVSDRMYTAKDHVQRLASAFTSADDAECVEAEVDNLAILLQRAKACLRSVKYTRQAAEGTEKALSRE